MEAEQTNWQIKWMHMELISLDIKEASIHAKLEIVAVITNA